LATIDRALQHMPSNVRMVIGSRVDPPLAISRMRADQQLTEVRARDLTFTTDEARTLLVEQGGLPLTSDQVASLVDRTQGWPAMIVLSGIWLRRVDDPASAVSRFGGDQRFVADYLSSEVMAALDEDRRAFLQGIAVLGQFTPGLCDSALGRTGSARMIEDLVEEGVFVSRLERGDWFRIHPLFAEYALLELRAAEPGAEKRIHHDAARWLAQGHPLDAMLHASAAEEPSLVAELLAEHHLDLLRSGAGRSVVHWADSLPDEVLIGHPEVAVAAGISCLLTSGGAMKVNRYLGLVEQAVSRGIEPADSYSAAAALIGRTLALSGGVSDALERGQRSVPMTQQQHDPLIDGAESAYARALYFAGDIDGACTLALRAIAHPDAARRVPMLIHAHSTLALVSVEQNRLSSAQRHVDQATELMAQIGSSRNWLGANALAARGALLLAQGRAAYASRELATAEGLFADGTTASVHHVWSLLMLARAQAHRGHLVEAAQLSGTAREALDELPDAGTLPALLAEVEQEIAAAQERATAGELVTALSDAELTVLSLIAEGLSIREIGARLYVSENTVRTHRRAVYRKLGVHSRDEAVARATALGILAGGSPGG
jgi:LuxR family maltose regulon positive regulatory protein